MLLTVTYVASFDAEKEAQAAEQFRQSANGWSMNTVSSGTITFIKTETTKLAIKDTTDLEGGEQKCSC